MKKSSILNIGFGGCGNKLVNEFLGKSKEYIGLFVNTAFEDAKDLEHFNIEKNAYIFAGTSGTGKNQQFAQEILKDQVQGLANTIKRYPNQPYVNIFFSYDGGTGGGIVPTFCKVLRRTCPEKVINLIGVIPDFNRPDELSFKNTINCWNAIADLLDGTVEVTDKQTNKKVELKVLNSVKFIDNSKRRTYKEINQQAIQEIHNSYCMNGKCDLGEIDDNDALRFNSVRGYSLILNLDNKYKDISSAIDRALDDTVFAKPKSFKCDSIGFSLSKDDFNILEAEKEFSERKKGFFSYNEGKNKHNTIVLTGIVEEPTEVIEGIKMAYDDLIEKDSDIKTKRTIIDLDKKSNDNIKIKNLQTDFDDDEFEDLFDDFV